MKIKEIYDEGPKDPEEFYSKRIANPVESVVCKWEWDEWCDYEIWETSCGKVFCITEGTPQENNYNYCPNCGGRLKQE